MGSSTSKIVPYKPPRHKSHRVKIMKQLTENDLMKYKSVVGETIKEKNATKIINEFVSARNDYIYIGRSENKIGYIYHRNQFYKLMKDFDDKFSEFTVMSSHVYKKHVMFDFIGVKIHIMCTSNTYYVKIITNKYIAKEIQLYALFFVKYGDYYPNWTVNKDNVKDSRRELSFFINNKVLREGLLTKIGELNLLSDELCILIARSLKLV